MHFIMKLIHFFVTAATACFLLLLYTVKIEPNLLVTHTYQLNASDKEASEQLRIVQISDIQVSQLYTEDKLLKLVEKVNKLSPDIIFFTGDLYENYALYGTGREEKIIDPLKNLKAKYGKFAIYGNRDRGGGFVRNYSDVLAQSDFTLLENSGVTLNLDNGQEIFIGGLDDALLGAPDIEKALSGLTVDSHYNILLAHEPDVADLYIDYPIDLILSGHSHGGQVRIPFSKGITTSLAKKYTEHFYTINKESGMQLYVNTGIGTSRLPVRFLVPPEIAVFDITLNG